MLDGDKLMRVPTELRHVLPAFRQSTTNPGRQIDLLRSWSTLTPLPARRGRRNGQVAGHRLIVELRRMTFKTGEIAPAPGKPVASVRLGSASTADSDEQIIEHCLNTLAGLNTDCFMTLLALVKTAGEQDGMVTDCIADIARRRGWSTSELDNRSRPTSRTRRERLREHMELLSKVEICITSLTDERGVFVALPLFQYVARSGEHDADRSEERLYQFHPLLWREMAAKQRVVLLDEALLSADPRRDEWSLRLLWYMSSRWGPSWVSKHLDKNGGRLRERLGVILAGAHIEHGHQLQRQGKRWLRRQFRGAMNKLVNWSPRSLIGGYEVVENAKSPLEDRITFWPTELVANRLTAGRSRAIARREAGIKRQSTRTVKGQTHADSPVDVE